MKEGRGPGLTRQRQHPRETTGRRHGPRRSGTSSKRKGATGIIGRRRRRTRPSSTSRSSRSTRTGTSSRTACSSRRTTRCTRRSPA
eukprot:1255339-Alexandrium_andersonii.AAC.1